ncbi:hypothetical protein FS837_000988 [Tulasnella sp. UAMH 9824]|nr:hypothetical protein FS837_000988 [Tulasnella sp. UAMH 9824]
MDHPASLGELETDIPIPHRSETAHVDVAIGTTGSPAQIVIKEIPLYRPRFLPSLLDSGEDSDNDDELVIDEQAKDLRPILADLLQATEDLRHINVVPILGFRLNTFKPYVVQPRYCSFEQWLVSHPELGIEERIRLLRDAAEGLHFVHSANLPAMPYHGRVHLHNILLRRRDSPGQPMVAAISDTYLQMTVEAADGILTKKYGPSLSGTRSSAFSHRGYIAPEFFAGEAAYGSQSGDVWAFGFTLLHAITRDWPPYLPIRLDSAGQLVRRTPDPFVYPATLPSNDPLWHLIFGAARAADRRYSMSEIIVTLDTRLVWDPKLMEAGTSSDKVLETSLDTDGAAAACRGPPSEAPELRGFLRFDRNIPLASDKLHAKVKFAYWETFGSAPMPVAVKEIKVRLVQGAWEETDCAVRRMLQEASVWQASKHTNILPLLGFRTQGQNPCLVSPWCPDGNLESYLKQRPDIEFSARLGMVVQVGLGLRFIHSRRIMHGDIKPKNVVIYEGRPSICDFGTARFVDAQECDSTSTEMEAITVRYAPPERLKTNPKVEDVRSDVWSFASLTLYVLSLKTPYHSYGSSETRQRILDGIVPQPEDHPLIPPQSGFWSILSACWLPEPSCRPAMSEVLGLLKEQCDEHGVEWPRDE